MRGLDLNPTQTKSSTPPNPTLITLHLNNVEIGKENTWKTSARVHGLQGAFVPRQRRQMVVQPSAAATPKPYMSTGVHRNTSDCSHADGCQSAGGTLPDLFIQVELTALNLALTQIHPHTRSHDLNHATAQDK